MSGSGAWPDPRFEALIGSRHPILLAPMAGAGGVELAVAAMEGGGAGALPCGLLDPEAVREQVGEVRSRADGPLNLNFFCHAMPADAEDGAWHELLSSLYRSYGLGDSPGEGPLRRPFDEAMCSAVEELKPEIVSFHFGLPDSDLLGRVRNAGCKVLATATTVAEARRLAERGVDAVIAQGFEAGGHAGRFLEESRPEEQMGLFALLPQIADAVHVPVIAAGGIADGRGIAAAFTLGAAAVQIGTAYLLCPESLIGGVHRAALGDEAAERTAFTNLFTGGLARGLPTRLTDDLGWIREEAPPYPLASAALLPIAKAANARGETGFMPMWAGQAARLAAALPARELTETLARDALARLAPKA
ncbi:MAG TPA: nitronate monooxygenase [Allosphingosinicella sp.]